MGHTKRAASWLCAKVHNEQVVQIEEVAGELCRFQSHGEGELATGGGLREKVGRKGLIPSCEILPHKVLSDRIRKGKRLSDKNMRRDR